LIGGSDPLSAQVIAARFTTTKALLAGMPTTPAFPPIDLQGKRTGGITPPHKENRMKVVALARGLVLFTLIAAGSASAEDSSRNFLVDHVRAANSRFTDVKAAVAEGYAPIPCASGIDGGAMGVHYVNGDYLKDEVPDIKRPQAVMYEPLPNGKMELVAVEYIASKGPAALEGQLFSFTGSPNRYGLGPFYELHVWAWKENPRGAFADMNPKVTCEHAHGK
jgi:hypothetical protein